jgi:hypothetical protein
MQIDESLTITIPVDRTDGSVVYVHASPIGREVFEKFWLPLSKTFSAIYGEGLGIIAGPRIAALMLRKVSIESGLWDGPVGVERGLIAEIHRLANVAAPGANGASGWQIYPYADALSAGMIDADDAAEIEGVLVFFTLVWRLHRQSDRRAILDGAVRLWGASMSSQSLSAFVGSLPSLTETGSTGGTLPEALLPRSSIGPAVPRSNGSSTIGPTPSRGERPMSSVSVT